MKKLYSVLLVVALMAALVLPVMAAPSPHAEAKAAKANASVPAKDASVTALTKEVYDAVKDVAGNSTHLRNLNVKESAKLAAAFDLEADIPSGKSSVTVPIKVSNAKAGDYAYVLHRRNDKAGTWELVGQGTLGEDLIVYATFTNFSPVAVMVVEAAQVKAETVKAPQTGQ